MTNFDTAAGQHAAPESAPAAIAGQAETFGGVALVYLDAADAVALDRLAFGVVGLDAAGRTQVYNHYESRLAGLSRESVLNQEFFLTTGICMNNFLVSQRFEDEPALDVILDYVLTFRMRPTPAKLRLLQRPGGRLHYILIQR